MESIIKRLENLEMQCKVLKDENNATKLTVKILEKKLLESDQKIRELTDQRQPASLENAGDVQNEKRFRHLERKMTKLQNQQEQQIEDVNVKLQKVDKLQLLFNSAILKKATEKDKLERLSSRMDSVSYKMDSVSSKMVSVSSRMDSVSDTMDDLKSMKATEECMTRVRDRNVPVSMDDYCELSALESIAGIPKGPAFQFVTSWYGNSEKAEFWRQEHLKKCHTKGINTKLIAMTEYVKLCDQHTCDNHMDDTQYHHVNHLGPPRMMAIDSGGLRFLDPVTKKESLSWPWNRVVKCELKKHGNVVLRFTNGGKTWFYTYENINPLVHATICSFLRK